MSFQWIEEKAAQEVAVTVPVAVAGRIERKRVVFGFEFHIAEYLDTFKRASLDAQADNIGDAGDAGSWECFRQFCASIEGDGFNGGSLAEKRRTVEAFPMLKKSAISAATVLLLRLRIEEAKLEDPLEKSASSSEPSSPATLTGTLTQTGIAQDVTV